MTAADPQDRVKPAGGREGAPAAPVETAAGDAAALERVLEEEIRRSRYVNSLLARDREGRGSDW